jgi:HK97 family phage prohead protease
MAKSDSPRLCGYAAVFNSYSEPMSDGRQKVREIIRPGAFSSALRSRQDVVAYYNHNLKGMGTSLPLGRVSAGTLRLFEDSHGLRYEIDPPDTQATRDLLLSVKRGDVRNSSFSFTVRTATGERWSRTDDGIVRELLDLNVTDISPVADPAYKATSCECRSASGMDKGVGTLQMAKNRLRLLEVSASPPRARQPGPLNTTKARIRLLELAGR